MTLPTSAASSATSGYTSKATIGRSTAAQYINIPPGYNSAGAYYVINAVANGSAKGPSSLSGSSATVSTGTNTLTLTKLFLFIITLLLTFTHLLLLLSLYKYK